MLYMGGKVVQGSGTAVITAIGPNTLLAKLIREKRFPPKESVLEAEDTGIALRTLS
jgi:magnesium-transporting ATPase (P-type)